MEAVAQGVRSLINSSVLFNVPYFQRRYVWNESNWERFADDMEGTIDCLDRYFLGAVILKKESLVESDRTNGVSDRYLVIDGQQRLTTLSIYLKVLYMLVDRNSEYEQNFLQDSKDRLPVLKHNPEDAGDFLRILRTEIPAAYGTNKEGILGAYNFFLNYLRESRDRRGVDLGALLRAVNRSVTFVTITLGNDENEQQIFDTINSLGVPLTTAELMKNFLYREEDAEQYYSCWNPVFDANDVCEFWEGDRAKSRQQKGAKTTNVEIFFHAFVRIKMWDFNDRMNAVQKKNFVKQQFVLDACKSFVNQFGMDRQALADEIIDYAKLYKENFDEKVLDERIPSYPCLKRLVCLIIATKKTAVIPYILYILKNAESEDEQNRIFGYLETYIVRRMLSEAEDKSYSEFFAESLICNRIVSFKLLRDVIEGKSEDANLSMPNDESVQRGLALRKKAVDESTARILYYMYESRIRGKEDNPIEGYNEYQADVLMPRPARGNYANWKRCDDNAEEDIRKELTGSLGNYFLMDSEGGKQLKRVKDRAFNEKIAAFRTYSRDIKCSKQYLENMYEWNAGEINKRNIGLAGVFNKVFSIQLK